MSFLPRMRVYGMVTVVRMAAALGGQGQGQAMHPQQQVGAGAGATGHHGGRGSQARVRTTPRLLQLLGHLIAFSHEAAKLSVVHWSEAPS
jgi:hypothetical protein